MKPGIFTRKKLREIIPGLTKIQENQIIDLYLMSREDTEEAGGDEERAYSGIGRNPKKDEAKCVVVLQKPTQNRHGHQKTVFLTIRQATTK